MWTEQEQDANEAAHDRLKEELERTYPLKHFVAFGHGQVIGASADFFELIGVIRGQGRDPREVMVIRIGDRELTGATIFSPFLGAS